jgi:sigma-B regulation protein RsbU (phosphoserine phosphatase)
MSDARSRFKSPAPSDLPAPGEQLFPLQNAAVLVADDSRTVRMALTHALHSLGFHDITEAHDGVQALDLVTQKVFDLVLLDLEMPGRSGMEVLAEIRANPRLSGLPVIVISADDQVERAVKCIEMGAEDYLPKPFNPTLLRARVSSCLEKKGLRDLDRRRFAELQAEKILLEQTQARLIKELDEAALYVRGILPEPMASPFSIDWHFEPCSELGGDAFGYHWVDAEHFAIYLLDVCGHGVGAALLSVMAISAIRSGALPGVDFRDPGAVLAALNTAFPMELHHEMYFTAWYGVYHAPTRTLRHASGGHPPALLLGADGALSEVREAGFIIGSMPGSRYSVAQVAIPPGARLIVLCDGTFEVLKPDGSMLDFESFKDFMASHGAEPDLFRRLLDWLRSLKGPGPLMDDFSIVRLLFP